MLFGMYIIRVIKLFPHFRTSQVCLLRSVWNELNVELVTCDAHFKYSYCTFIFGTHKSAIFSIYNSYFNYCGQCVVKLNGTTGEKIWIWIYELNTKCADRQCLLSSIRYVLFSRKQTTFQTCDLFSTRIHKKLLAHVQLERVAINFNGISSAERERERECGKQWASPSRQIEEINENDVNGRNHLPIN